MYTGSHGHVICMGDIEVYNGNGAPNINSLYVWLWLFAIQLMIQYTF